MKLLSEICEQGMQNFGLLRGNINKNININPDLDTIYPDTCLRLAVVKLISCSS